MKNNKLIITDSQLATYEQSRIKRNLLCPLPLTKATVRESELGEAERRALDIALRPKCVTIASVLLYNDGLLKLLSAARGGDAVLIGRDGDSHVLIPCGAMEATIIALANLLADGEVNRSQAGVELPMDSFLLLMAIADCYKRRYVSSLLRHELTDAPLSVDDLVRTLEESYSQPDSRWLFPFVLTSLDFPTIRDMQTALNGLCNRGLLEPEGLKLTADGQHFVDELLYHQGAAHLQTLRVQGNELLVENMLLLRTKESLWCILLGEDSVEMTTITPDDLLKLATAISEDLDEPRDDTDVLQEQSKKTAPIPNDPAQLSAESWQCICGSVNTGRFCSGCGKPKHSSQTEPIANVSWQCACGNMNKGGFCPKCGSKRTSSSAVPADGNWCCSCGRTNEGGFCPKCGSKRPQ